MRIVSMTIRTDLPEEEALLLTQMSVDNLSDAVYWIRENGSIAYVNKAACEMLEFSREQLLAKRIYELNLEVPEKAWSVVWAQLAEAGRRTFETIHVTKSGRPVPVEVAANFLSFGGKTYSCAFTRDLSERKELEARLRQAEKMEAIGRLAGGVAHDFNNQLGGMMGAAELLKARHADNPQSLRLLDAILQSVDRSSDLTAQLLAFSRQGRSVSKPVSVDHLLAEIGDILRHSIDKRISQSQDLQATKTVVIGDATQLQSAILNLALNARDAMPRGGKLHFSTKNEWLSEQYCQQQIPPLTPGEFLRITVTDTGEGMDPHTQTRIFEPFFTTKNMGTGQGTGLGLAAVYAAVKNHQGSMSVTSCLGKGTSIALLLPVTGRNHSLPIVPRPSLSAAPEGIAGTRVLLVEDEEYLRDACRLLLEALGCAVQCAADGREAVDYFTEHHPQIDVVLLDWEMPVLGGADTLTQLRYIASNTPVIIVSGYGKENTAGTLSDCNVDGFLQKPYSHSQLAEILEATVSRNDSPLNSCQ